MSNWKMIEKMRGKRVSTKSLLIFLILIPMLLYNSEAYVHPVHAGVVFHETFDGVPAHGGKAYGGKTVEGIKGTGWTSTANVEGYPSKVFIEYQAFPSLFGDEGTIEFYVKRTGSRIDPANQEGVIEFLDIGYNGILLVGMLWEHNFIDDGNSAIEVIGNYHGVDLPGQPWGGEILSLGRNVATGTWVHVAVTWGPSLDDHKVYVDGKSLTKYANIAKKNKRKVKGETVGVLLAGTTYIRIGAETYHVDPDVTWSPLFNSVVDELKIHDVAFNPYLESKKPMIASITDDTFFVPGISGMITTGDAVHVRLEAEKGGSATFDMGVVTGVLMTEVKDEVTGEGTGIYEGSYTVKPGDDFEDGRIVGHFASSTGVSAEPVTSDSSWTIDTGTSLALEMGSTDLPADTASKTRIKVAVTDVNGDPVRDHQIRVDLATTEEYTGLVGAGDFAESVGAEVEASWKSVTDSWGEVEFDYRSGFAAKTVIVTAKDLTTGSVGVGYITSYIDALIDIALTRPVSKAAARRGLLYYLEVEATRTELTADGRSRSVIRANVYDPNGNPVEGDTIEFSLDQENGTLRTIKAVTDKNGRATAEYRAGKKIGIVQVTATDITRGLTGYVSITLLSDAPAKIYLAARPDSLPADGFSRSDIEVKVTDVNDNPNEDTEVLFNLVKGAGELRNDSLVTDRYGEATNTFISGKDPGIATIRATVKSKIPTEEEVDRAKNVLFALYSDLDDEMQVTKWLVRKGDEVQEGSPLCEYTIRGEKFTLVAPFDLSVDEVLVETWDDIEVGQTLALVSRLEMP